MLSYLSYLGFAKRRVAGLNLEISFSNIVYRTTTKEPSLSYYLQTEVIVHKMGYWFL